MSPRGRTPRPTTSEESRVVSADPTKEFFIHILTKDIELLRAIVDLVDNSVDGARRLQGDGPYRGLHVDVQVNSEEFEISDNCGGISVELARKYAFRFGRPPGTAETPHSVGQFGVGMKRALFKLGAAFRVESTTATERFVIEENVDEWKKKEGDWTFRFDQLEQGHRFQAAVRGTVIRVAPLHRTVAEDFKNEKTMTRLALQIAEAHRYSLENGLRISLNAHRLAVEPLTLLHSDQIVPVNRAFKLTRRRDGTVSVKLYTGVTEAGLPGGDAGWYVFCNGRLVMRADQSPVTGWGETGVETIPKYHPQFARFRGYLFLDSNDVLDSNDASLLPWNTTKTGLDADSPTYRKVRLEMLKAMRPVITSLNKLDAEIQIDAPERPLTSALDNAKPTRLANLPLSSAFVAPREKPGPPLPKVGRISYTKPVDQIDRAKEILGATTNRQVGEETFDDFYKRECLD